MDRQGRTVRHPVLDLWSLETVDGGAADRHGLAWISAITTDLMDIRGITSGVALKMDA